MLILIQFDIMIKKIRLALFAPFHFVNLILGFQKFKKNNQNTPSHYQSLINSFCFSLGRSNTFLSKIITKQFPPSYKYLGNGLLSHVNFEKVNEEINEKGYHIFDKLLSEDIVEKLSHFAKTNKSTTRLKTVGGGNIIELIYDPNDKKAVRYDYKEEDLINNSTVQELMTDTSILNIAQSYLNTTPIVDVTAMWWNTDYQKEPDSEAAQYFHFDMDRIKWLKFFFYITDVDEDKGPHSFVEGSHKDGGIPYSMTSKGYSRLSDEEVLSHYGKDRIKVFSAPKGTIIAEDTRGLHKGTNVINGDRLIFQIQFSNTLFGASYKKSKLDLTKDEKLKSLDNQYPRILMNYK